MRKISRRRWSKTGSNVGQIEGKEAENQQEEEEEKGSKVGRWEEGKEMNAGVERLPEKKKMCQMGNNRRMLGQARCNTHGIPML